MFPTGSPTDELEDVAAVADLPAEAETEPSPAPAPVELATPAVPQPAPALAAVTPAPRVVRRTAPRGPSASEFTPVRAQRAVSPPPAASPASRSVPEAEALADGQPRPGGELATVPAAVSASVPAWDVDDDVRVLSLRLQELRRQNQGLVWDESAEAFGAPADAAGAAPGVQTVREGAAPTRAQIRVRADSARSNQ